MNHIYGAGFFIQSNFAEDSILVKFIKRPDYWNSIYHTKLVQFKIKCPEYLKSAFDNFKRYTDTLKNGTLPNSYFRASNFAAYDGGDYIIYFKDKNNNERYFSYILANLSEATIRLNQIIIDSIFYKRPGVNRQELKINTDSIVTVISRKPGMDQMIRPPLKVDAPPTLFMAPKKKARK